MEHLPAQFKELQQKLQERVYEGLRLQMTGDKREREHFSAHTGEGSTHCVLGEFVQGSLDSRDFQGLVIPLLLGTLFALSEKNQTRWACRSSGTTHYSPRTVTTPPVCLITGELRRVCRLSPGSVALELWNSGAWGVQLTVLKSPSRCPIFLEQHSHRSGRQLIGTTRFLSRNVKSCSTGWKTAAFQGIKGHGARGAE